MRVAVLGCGPTGLVAAQAATSAGADVAIFSKYRKSELFGAQYLHQPIPGIDAGQPALLTYSLQGTDDGYRAKVYGDRWTGEVSTEKYNGMSVAYDIRSTYNALWDYFSGAINDALLDYDSVKGIVDRFDLVISSIPAPVLCRGGCTFASQDIWAMGDAPERGQFVPYHDIDDNSVICNGEDAPSWYRLSHIFGYKTVEWSQNVRKPPMPVSEVRKPLFNNCSCWSGHKVFRVGRYGLWKKGVLVHDAFRSVIGLAAGRVKVESTWSHKANCPYGSDLAESTKHMMGCRCNG